MAFKILLQVEIELKNTGEHSKMSKDTKNNFEKACKVKSLGSLCDQLSSSELSWTSSKPWSNRALISRCWPSK